MVDAILTVDGIICVKFFSNDSCIIITIIKKVE